MTLFPLNTAANLPILKENMAQIRSLKSVNMKQLFGDSYRDGDGLIITGSNNKQDALEEFDKDKDGQLRSQSPDRRD